MIPAIQELNFPKIDGKQYATLSHATVNLADMGEKTISTQVKINGDITPDFSRDWEVAFQGEKYIMPLRQPQGAKENTSLNSTIDLTFQHWAIYQLKRWMFFTVQPVETGTAVADKYIADVILNLGDFCNLFGQVLRHYYSDTITIDLNPDWDYKQEAVPVSINHSYIWDVLIKLYELFAVRWSIEPDGDSSHYVIKVGYPAEELDHIFEYGFEGGLLKVERQVQSEDIRNMLLGRGGEKNIPKYYFKKSPDEEKWRSDPDWIEELANIYFTNLMGATFRSYVQGWKAAHISKYPGYAAVGESNAYAPWAYRKGYTDSKFDPVEYVKDDESISKYGPLLGGLDNNEEIYPSIQGSGMDVAVDVEQIESDDVEESVENDAVLARLHPIHETAESVPRLSYKTIIIDGGSFDVDKDKHANLDVSLQVARVRDMNGRELVPAETAQMHGSPTINVYNSVTGEKRSASGIPEGAWRYEVVAEVRNLISDKTLNITVEDAAPKLYDATIGDDSWKDTFDIWVKNIWETSKLSTETNDQYSERVWVPILGDREQNTAKVMFTTGDLAVSEDYEFTIVDFPKLDTSKSLNGERSHWRIKLAKSDADLESTGLYVPSTQRQGKAGDKFVFIGTEMTHHYVVWAETALDDWKKDQLREKKDIKPTWVVTTDRVRLNNEGKADALIQQLRIGNSLRLADKRFITETNKQGEVVPSSPETLYLQSITYTYREPSSDDAALNPDVAIVLSNEYATVANPVATMQGEISALQRQIGSISNVEQIVRAVGDRLYLRKDGISDRSLSPTQFFSLLTSSDFRNGILGGRGWGFFKDPNGNWVLETDRINVRQEMQVTTLVINQAEGRGGMEIDTAAHIETTRVVDTDDGFVCYFDLKEGSVANLFHVGDVAYCQRWTPANNNLKFYKRRVTAVGANSITLANGNHIPEDWPDSGVNGSGIPEEKDNIIHFGNYIDKTRQYVKIRDVVGGGYERYLEELDSVNAAGVEYYFAGRQDGQLPRWFIGNKDLVPYSGRGDGSYIEYRDRKLSLNNVKLSLTSTVGDKPIDRYVEGKVGEIEIGGSNLLLGTRDFTTPNWINAVNMISVGYYQGCQARKTANPVTVCAYQPYNDALPGEYYTFSTWFKCVYVGGSVFLGIRGGEVSSVPIENSVLDGKWHRVSAVFKAKSAGIAVQPVTSNSQNVLYVAGYKLEKGNVPTAWDEAPQDIAEPYSYLREALRQSTEVEGGLVQTSLVMLGFSDSSGTRHVQAGSSGLPGKDKPGGGIAFWAGGINVDADDKDDQRMPASYVVRMDGTGYMAGNTLRFGFNEVMVGDDIALTDSGLMLKSGGDVKGRITNNTIGDYDTIINTRRNYYQLDYSNIGITAVYGDDGFNLKVSPAWRQRLGAVAQNGSLRATITFTLNLPFALTPPSDPFIIFKTPKAVLTVRGDSAGYSRQYIVPLAYQQSGIYTFSVDVDVVNNAQSLTWYEFELSFYGSDPLINPKTRQFANQAATVKGYVEASFGEATTLGNDGFMSVWNNSLMLINNDMFVARVGDFAFKIDKNGFWKSVTGGGPNTWVKANL